jgi:hypothetical protein
MPLRTSLDSIPLLDSADMERRQKILKIIDEGIVNRLEELGLPVSEGKLDVIAEGIPLAANAVSWLALLCFALFFVIPYLLFGGWGKGLFYMIILGVAFIADKILTKTAPSWFSLKPGSAAGSFIVVFVVFANALLFDWLYDLATMRRKSCISCSSNIEEADRYCKKCGFMQI